MYRFLCNNNFQLRFFVAGFSEERRQWREKMYTFIAKYFIMRTKIFFRLIVPAILLSNLHSNAQNDAGNTPVATDTKPLRHNSNSRLGLTAVFGIAQYNYNAINDQLKPLGLPLINNHSYCIAGSLLLMSDDKSFIDVSGAQSQARISNNKATLDQSAFNEDVNYNYIFFHTDRHSVLAALGFGYAMQKATYTVKTENQSFVQAATTLANETTFTNSGYYLNIKAGYDWRIKKTKNLFLGLRAGYRIGLNNAAWNTIANTLTNAPKTSAGGYYIGAALTVL
jgi:hypothetical protein